MQCDTRAQVMQHAVSPPVSMGRRWSGGDGEELARAGSGHLRHKEDEAREVGLATLHDTQSMILGLNKLQQQTQPLENTMAWLNALPSHAEMMHDDDNQVTADDGVVESPTHISFLTFTSVELRQATNDFCRSCVIGKGGFGTVYRGRLHGLAVAVKRMHLDNASSRSVEVMFREIDMLKALNHQHVVRIYGWCPEEMSIVFELCTVRPLVPCYELASTSPLHHHPALPPSCCSNHHALAWFRPPADHPPPCAQLGSLKEQLPNLQWFQRLRIATEVAQGVLYLHQQVRAYTHRPAPSARSARSARSAPSDGSRCLSADDIVATVFVALTGCCCPAVAHAGGASRPQAIERLIGSPPERQGGGRGAGVSHAVHTQPASRTGGGGAQPLVSDPAHRLRGHLGLHRSRVPHHRQRGACCALPPVYAAGRLPKKTALSSFFGVASFSPLCAMLDHD